MKEVLQVAYLRHLQDFCLFESVKDGIIFDARTPFKLRAAAAAFLHKESD